MKPFLSFLASSTASLTSPRYRTQNCRRSERSSNPNLHFPFRHQIDPSMPQTHTQTHSDSCKWLDSFVQNYEKYDIPQFLPNGHFDKKNLVLIVDCFPLLQELNLCNPWLTSDTDFMVDHKDPLLALPNLRKINLSGNYIGDPDQFANFLRHNCTLLQEITPSLGNLRNMIVLVL